MTADFSLISLDLWLILRVLTAFSWGWGYGAWLHTTRTGQTFEREFTWLATVIGVGVDLSLAFPGNWWAVTCVIAASSVGVITMALIHGYQKSEVNIRSYKVKWGLEDATAQSHTITDKLTELLRTTEIPQEVVCRLSEILAAAHTLNSQLIATRRGDYLQKK